MGLAEVPATFFSRLSFAPSFIDDHSMDFYLVSLRKLVGAAAREHVNRLSFPLCHRRNHPNLGAHACKKAAACSTTIELEFTPRQTAPRISLRQHDTQLLDLFLRMVSSAGTGKPFPQPGVIQASLQTTLWERCFSDFF